MDLIDQKVVFIGIREHFSEKLGNEEGVWKIYTENNWASVEGLAISKELGLRLRDLAISHIH